MEGVERERVCTEPLKRLETSTIFILVVSLVSATEMSSQGNNKKTTTKQKRLISFKKGWVLPGTNQKDDLWMLRQCLWDLVWTSQTA